MRSWIFRVFLLGSVTLVASGCASSEEWAEWTKHPSHFATGEHLFFSFRNTEGSGAKVTRADIERARTEQWWGKVITASPEQLIEQ